ncbi:MAG: 1,4-alpha-glucan branching enzyme, partial [Cryptosporangiaceae bacterium]|nr:1,4-alpha-glucan branching enzyme [Cryptosporangiaceae bacterium]
WGSGKDWRVWDGAQVSDLVADGAAIQERLLAIADKPARTSVRTARDPALDQLAREALLALSSDWAFMVTKDSAAGYARDRAAAHASRFAELAGLIESGRPEAALTLAAQLRRIDGPFGHLDARTL